MWVGTLAFKLVQNGQHLYVALEDNKRELLHMCVPNIRVLDNPLASVREICISIITIN